MRTLAALSIAVLAASGCDILEPGWSRQPGLVVEDPHHFHSLIAPDVGTRGTPFQITASTFGSSSCNRAD